MYESVNPLKVNIISDVHYYAKSHGVSGKAFEKDDAKDPNEIIFSEEILVALTEQLKKDDSEIIILTGDTTYNGEKDSHKGIIKLLYELKKSGKKVYATTATHDFQETGFTKLYDADQIKDVPTYPREELLKLYWNFGPSEAISIHEASMSYIVKIAPGYRLFNLNDDSNGKGSSGFSEDCLNWIEAQVKKAHEAGDFIIATTHHPMISPSPFYKIIGGGNIMGEANEIIEKFSKLGIDFVFTGHTHIQDISFKITDNGKPFYDITTASPVGYPSTYRRVIFDPAKGTVDVKSIDVNCEIKGRKVKEHLEDKFFGMVKRVIEAAAKDIPTLADMVIAFSVDSKLIYKIGWIIKPFAKIINSLKIGTVAKLCRKESGVTKEEIENIKDEKVLDFIISLVKNLYGGDSPYTPETPHYKITMGLLSIIDSLLGIFKINIKKLLKEASSVQGLIEPLLYNSGICDAEAVINLKATKKELPNPKEGFIKSKKGLPLLLGIIFLVLLLLPIILLWLIFGFTINYIKYHKGMKDDE